MRVGAHLDDAASGAVGALDAVGAHDESARREVRAFDDGHQFLHRRLGVVDQHQRAVDDLAHIVGRNVRRHADGDARSTVDEELREFRRQHRRLFQRFVVVRDEIHRFLVDVLQHQLRDLRHADLGITHGRRRIAVHGAEVAVAVGQQVAHGEILRHADDRVIDRAVAVGMIFTQDLTDDTRRFLIRFVRAHARFLHRVEDTPMHRLQAVADVRQRARHDDAHRVVDIGGGHDLRKIHRYDFILANLQNLTLIRFLCHIYNCKKLILTSISLYHKTG